MNAETFCEHFATFADAPNGIEKLRELIRTLAVRGKLVAQDWNDEPAVDIVEKIRAEKRRLSETGDLKSDKKTWVSSLVNPPNAIPASWCWVRLQDVFEISRGGSPRPAGDPRYFGGSIPWITVGEVTKDSGKYLTGTTGGLTEEGACRSRFINPDDLLLTNSGATLGVPKISKIRGCMNDGVAVLRQFHQVDLNEFAYLYLTQQTFAFRSVNQGMGQPNLNTPIIAGWFFPFPPLAEQRRIVDKVDQLLGLCDELAARQAAQREKRQRLVRATLDRLVSTRNPAESRTNAQRLRNHFDQLFATTTAIPQLRQTILQLAVQGQLVPQDPGDAPTETVHVGEVVSFLGGYAFKSEWFQDRPGIRLVRNQNISHGCLDWTETEYLPASRAEEFDKFTLHPGDMVLSLNRPFISTGLKLAWIQDSDCPCLLVQRVACMRPDRSRLLPEFLYLWCNAPDFYRNAHVVPSSGVPYIATNRVEKMCMTLPPLAEQKRIVTKVTELLSLCDALEAKLTQAESASTRLLSAAVHQLLNGAVANV